MTKNTNILHQNVHHFKEKYAKKNLVFWDFVVSFRTKFLTSVIYICTYIYIYYKYRGIYLDKNT